MQATALVHDAYLRLLQGAPDRWENRRHFIAAAAEAMRSLAIRGIGTRPFFWPMHEQPIFRRMGLFANESHPHSERLARRGFYLPSGLALTEDQIATSAAALRELFT